MIEPHAADRSSAVADSELKELDPNVIPAARISGLIVTALLGAAGLVGCGMAWIQGWLPQWGLLLLSAGALAILGLLVWLSLAWPKIEYRHTRYQVGDLGIEIRKGVLWRRIINVPRSRIQHTDVSQGPIQRRFGIATLTVHTAGTADASVELAGLGHATARAIRDYLVGWGQRDGV